MPLNTDNQKSCRSIKSSRTILLSTQLKMAQVEEKAFVPATVCTVSQKSANCKGSIVLSSPQSRATANICQSDKSWNRIRANTVQFERRWTIPILTIVDLLLIWIILFAVSSLKYSTLQLLWPLNFFNCNHFGNSSSALILRVEFLSPHQFEASCNGIALTDSLWMTENSAFFQTVSTM